MELPIKLYIPDSFFLEEEKCGHLVTAKEKKVWAVELDLLNEFKRVCEKYQLSWFIAYGSLIGAIRHRGFIPWDNDVDVLMPRADFDRLNEIASSEFTGNYWWQTPVTENGRYFQDFAKLRNTKTTCYAEDLMLQGINCGIYIDIFVLDDIPDDGNVLAKINRRCGFYSHMSRFLSPYRNKYKGIKWIKHQVWRAIHRILYHNCKGDYIFTKINDLYRSTQGKGCHNVGYFGDPHVFDRALFSSMQMIPFEMIEVPVPIGYDEILKIQYGDYMQFPPIDERATHEYFMMDAEIPYEECGLK